MKSLSSINQITGALLAGVNSAIEFERENQILNKTEKAVTKFMHLLKLQVKMKPFVLELVSLNERCQNETAG